MIYKSYLVEENFKLIDKNINLFYGENIGLLNSFKNKIKLNNKEKAEIINFTQDEILSNKIVFKNEITNQSLFSENRIFIIDQTTDKILEHIDEILSAAESSKFFLFANILEKKSKLRKYFEIEQNCSSIACYDDNEITLRKITLNKLKDFQPVSQRIINMIVENCNGSRVKLYNELDKIIIFFNKTKIDDENLANLLNIVENDNFNTLKNAALNGDKKLTNKLLSETIIDEDKTILYLSVISQRANQINQINKNFKGTSYENAITKIKPPIYWKEKPNFINQLKKWQEGKTNLLLKNLYEIELNVKKNSKITKNNLIKKLMVDICTLANAS